MANYSGTVIESQVDYLTVSAHGQDAARNMLDLALGLAEEEKAKGNRERRWRLMGYEGTHCGAIEYGQRDSYSTILRASGQTANDVLQAGASVADTVTRLDLAVTWRCEPPDPYLGPNAYSLAEQWYQADKRRARPSLLRDADGGGTCYVGARESENFLRIYNKEVECVATGDAEGAERYKGCWRYELEAKGSVAPQLLDVVLAQELREPYIQGYLYHWCQQHGIEPAFPLSGQVGLIPGFRRRSDADSKLRHLKRNVRPTADWLRQNGYEENLREVLGFDLCAGLLRELEAYYPGGARILSRSAPEGRGEGKEIQRVED